MNERFLNQVTQGDCIDLVQQLEDDSLDAAIADPPYGEGMGYEGDESSVVSESLLQNLLRALYPKLKPNAHLAVFYTMRNVDVPIDAVRALGYTFRRIIPMYIPKGGARPYLGWLPRTQAIVVAQKYIGSQPTEFHGQLAPYLREAIQATGMTNSQVARALRCDSRLIMKWTRIGDPAWCLPTPRFYAPLKELLKLDGRFDVLLSREPSPQGRPSRQDFTYQHDFYIVDEKRDGLLHPSQKPLSVLEHLVPCVTPMGGTVLDAFSGSGTASIAALRTGRNYIAVEVSPDYAEIARQRLAEEKTNIPPKNPVLTKHGQEI